eukprot:snap_masked-scaffold_31-processed-gene-0.4-mRNA-1 protein AED:1.00 eAED:1.00 QI:0/0/0/0/1/1/2/0/66
MYRFGRYELWVEQNNAGNYLQEVEHCLISRFVHGDGWLYISASMIFPLSLSPENLNSANFFPNKFK